MLNYGEYIGRFRIMLDNLGIIVDLRSAFSDYAQLIGKTAKELTPQEELYAFTYAATHAINRWAIQLANYKESDNES